MGDPSQRARRVARAVDDLRLLRSKAPEWWLALRRERSVSRRERSMLPSRVPEIDAVLARPDARILRRLQAVENALEELVLELQAAAAHEGRAVELDDRMPELARAAGSRQPPDTPPRIELDDPFGMLARPDGAANSNGSDRPGQDVDG
jgi:hypothetical protein